MTRPGPSPSRGRHAAPDDDARPREDLPLGRHAAPDPPLRRRHAAPELNGYHEPARRRHAAADDEPWDPYEPYEDGGRHAVGLNGHGLNGHAVPEVGSPHPWGEVNGYHLEAPAPPAVNGYHLDEPVAPVNGFPYTPAPPALPYPVNGHGVDAAEREAASWPVDTPEPEPPTYRRPSHQRPPADAPHPSPPIDPHRPSPRDPYQPSPADPRHRARAAESPSIESPYRTPAIEPSARAESLYQPPESPYRTRSVESPYRAPAEPPYRTPPADPPYRTPPAESLYQAPAESRYSAPAESPYRAPAESPYRAPAGSPYPAPAESPYRAPVESPYRAPVESPYRAPVESPYRAPVESPYRAPVGPSYAAAPVEADHPAPTVEASRAGVVEPQIAVVPLGEEPTETLVRPRPASAPDAPSTQEPAGKAAKPPHPPRAVVRRRRARRKALEWPFLIVFALLSAFLIRQYVVQTFFIPSASMHETLIEGDRVLVNKVGYHLHDVHRGDVVVFRKPANIQVDEDDLIKRVVALPGETVEGRGGKVYVNGAPLDESYVEPLCHGTGEFPKVTVPAGRLWVMGDNRCNSSDSRVFGPIPEDLVVGRAFVIAWPFDRFSWL